MARYELNDERNGIEIYFDSVPSEEIRMKLRESGWRWFKVKKCWYTKQSEKSIEYFYFCEYLGGEIGTGTGEEFEENNPGGIYVPTTLLKRAPSVLSFPLLPSPECTFKNGAAFCFK